MKKKVKGKTMTTEPLTINQNKRKIHPNADPYKWGVADAVTGMTYDNPWKGWKDLLSIHKMWRYFDGYLHGQELYEKHRIGRIINGLSIG